MSVCMVPPHVAPRLLGSIGRGDFGRLGLDHRCSYLLLQRNHSDSVLLYALLGPNSCYGVIGNAFERVQCWQLEAGLW